jgi:hypothetical protein
MVGLTPMAENAGETRLVPYRSVKVRWAVFGALFAFSMIGPSPWLHRLFFAVTMAALVGTFPRAWVGGGMFQREFLLAFVRVHFKQWDLGEVEQLETGLEEKLGWLYGCLLGFPTVIFGKILDWFLPWLGGDFKIWLRTFRGDRILAWQGRSEKQFRQNLDFLEETLDRPAARGSDYDVMTPAQLADLFEELPGGSLVKKLRSYWRRRG